VPDFEFKGFKMSSVSPSECRPCGIPSESSASECRPCRTPSESSTSECRPSVIHSESGRSTPYGLICTKDVGIQEKQGVNPRAGIQMLPTGLLSCEESMVLIADSGASRTSIFNHRDFVPVL